MIRQSISAITSLALDTFVSLKSRNYRLFFMAQLVSNTGLWMQRLAMGWLVYRITDSATKLALVEFASLAPVLFLSAISGAALNRFDMRRLLIFTQILSAGQAIAVGIVAYLGLESFPLIFCMSLFLGVVNGVDNPARLSAVPMMVDKREHLANAIALNSMAFNLSRLIGPTIAGYMVAYMGEWVCFMANGVSFCAVVAALYAMRLPAVKVTVKKRSIFAELSDGIQYARYYLPVKTGILTIMVASFFCGPYIAMFPIFAKSVLNGDATLLGNLLASAGAGALVGSFICASRPPRTIKQPRIMVALLVIFSVALIVFALSRNTFICLLVSPFAGFGLIASYILVNTLLQRTSSEEKRGHVMGIYSAMATGFYPFGTLVAGTLADKIGAPYTMVGYAVASLIAAGVLFHHLPAIEKSIADSGHAV